MTRHSLTVIKYRSSRNAPGFPWVLGLIVLLILFVLSSSSKAATFDETNSFRAARMNFDMGFWGLAERGFDEFARKYTNSQYFAQAVLYEARAVYNQKTNLSAVIYLLSKEQPRAGALADQFIFWIGEAQLSATNYPAAAATFARLLKEHPESERVLEAAVGQAEALSKLQDWPEVVAVLSEPSGAFRQIAKARPADDLVVRGFLLLGEAQSVQKDYAAAEDSLRSLAGQKLPPDAEWSRQRLLGRIQIAAGQVDDALVTGSNMVALATAAGRKDFQAESVNFQAGTLERLDRLSEAVRAYEAYLLQDPPVAQRRQAIYKIVDLNLRQNNVKSAAASLSDCLARYPDEKNSDLGLLTLGELNLRIYYQAADNAQSSNAAPSDTATNLLQQAITNFQGVAASSTNTEFAGRAYLNLGWCLAAEGRLGESGAAFSNAVSRLPFSEDQAVARFKLADVQYRLGDFGGAAVNYGLVINQYRALPAVTNELFEPALYQIARAGLEQTNVTIADDAMDRLLAWYPNGPLLEPGLFLLGEGLGRQGNAARAREVFSQFATRFPNSARIPEVRLAIARTYEREANWPAALNEYTNWLAIWTNHPSLPRAEFACASAFYSAGQETNALGRFTNFVARFTTNELAPLAQYWVAEFYFRHEAFLDAEVNYAEVFTKWPASPLADQARMMAGRAAMAREAVPAAVEHFTNLTIKADLPLPLRLEASFAYGDALTKLSNFNDAISIFGVITNTYPSNQIAPRALGRIGDCCFQLASLDPARYPFSSATNAYQGVIDSPLADITARSEAEVMMARTLREMAKQAKTPVEQDQLLVLALEHDVNVVNSKNLREGEGSDQHWTNEAGLDAGSVAEELALATDDPEQWQTILRLYNDLERALPSMTSRYESRISRVREKLAPKK